MLKISIEFTVKSWEEKNAFNLLFGTVDLLIDPPHELELFGSDSIISVSDETVFLALLALCGVYTDNPWRLDAYKMRYDSKYWFPSSVPLPGPVVNKSYLLMCEVRGSVRPTPSISWYLGGREITTGKHFYIIVCIPIDAKCCRWLWGGNQSLGPATASSCFQYRPTAHCQCQ